MPRTKKRSMLFSRRTVAITLAAAPQQRLWRQNDSMETSEFSIPLNRVITVVASASSRSCLVPMIDIARSTVSILEGKL